MDVRPRETVVLAVDMSGVDAEARTVDMLARLQLTARRGGCELKLRNVSDELRELIAFMGLADVLREK